MEAGREESSLDATRRRATVDLIEELATGEKVRR